MKIDKLTLLHEMPASWKEGMVQRYIDLITDTSSQSKYGITRSHSAGCSGYQVSIEGRVPLSTSPLIWSKQAGYLLQAGPKGSKKAWMRLDINPDCLNPIGLAHLQEMLAEVFDVAWPVWSFARVSRIDVAVDLQGIELTDWVWDIPKRSARELICRGRELRTIYIGAKKSSPLVVYNKAKQDPAAAPSGVLTRVEYRVKNAGLVGDLLGMDNPLADLIVFNPRMLNYPGPQWFAMMSAGHLHSIRGILQTFPKPVRASVGQALTQTRASWWDPAKVWGAWSQCLHNTLPSEFTPLGKPHDAAAAYLQSMKAEAKAAGENMQLTANSHTFPNLHFPWDDPAGTALLTE